MQLKMKFFLFALRCDIAFYLDMHIAQGLAR